MNLFLDQDDYVKEAAFASRVSEQPENWPQELNSELFKQLPYLSDYDVNVNLDRVEPQRGFAFGFADVANKTERPGKEQTEMGLPHIRIPIIIMDKAVKPFSVFLDGTKVLPLSEERVRSILFNPGSFDLSTSQPKDPSLIEAMMPPTRYGTGMNSEYKMASVMMAIAPTIRESDVKKFKNKLASDAAIVAGFRRSNALPIITEAIYNTKRYSADETLEKIASHITPTVVSLLKLPNGDFFVREANVNAFLEKTAAGQVVPNQEVAQAAGDQTAQQMQPGQTATAVAEPVPNPQPQVTVASKSKIIDSFGQYKVLDTLGNSLLGHVFPSTIGWNGDFTPQSIALFSNGSCYSFQETIAGELVGKGTTLPVDDPRGEGCFYTTKDGDAVATQPVTVASVIAGPDGQPKLQASDSFGNQLTITKTVGLQEPMQIANGEVAIPDSWKFMRLNNQVQVAATPDVMGKMASARSKNNEVILFFNGAFQLQGGCGLEKVSRDLRYDLDASTAEFMLGLLGVDGYTAKAKVAEARKTPVKLASLKTIELLGARHKDVTKLAAKQLSDFNIKPIDLIKEASMLGEDDEDTVDKLLSLNFMTPENLYTFINYIPEFENTQEKLAEMLLFSYLGMKELPEAAISRSMDGMEGVLLELKNISGAEV